MIEKSLEKIHFNPDNGLVLCDKLKGAYIGELCHIQEKAKRLGAVAVLFRRKYNENNKMADSKPVLYIYEKEDDFYNSEEHEDLHARIWSAGDIEVYFIISELCTGQKVGNGRETRLFSRTGRLSNPQKKPGFFPQAFFCPVHRYLRQE